VAHPLDNPLWSSLTTLHRAHAHGTPHLLRYPAEVAPFVATTGAGDAALGEIVAPGEIVFFVGPRAGAPAGWRADDLGVILQMVSGEPIAEVPGPPIALLGERERAHVLELAALVYPHYFRPRTPELGRYFGIFDGGTLAAMIGERMGFPGYREISAVCTHPDFVGRGLARRLLAYLTTDIAAHGDTPFLHVSPANTRAVQLYEANGYRTRTAIAFASVTRP
jgi:ribosomal protein S18 acetylase RimI-like enzyme